MFSNVQVGLCVVVEYLTLRLVCNKIRGFFDLRATGSLCITSLSFELGYALSASFIVLCPCLVSSPFRYFAALSRFPTLNTRYPILSQICHSSAATAYPF